MKYEIDRESTKVIFEKSDFEYGRTLLLAKDDFQGGETIICSEKGKCRPLRLTPSDESTPNE